MHPCVHFLYINAKKFFSWNIFWVQFRTRCETRNSPFNNFYHHLYVYSGHLKENTNIYKGAVIHSQPKSKFAIKAFSLRNRIWSSFSPERLARWSVATRPPYEKCLSKFVELGGGVRCCLVTLMKAFLRLSLGKYANQGCVPSTFSKWIHHGLVGGLPAMVVVRRVCLLVPVWIAQFSSGNYIFISLKLSVKSSLNASMTSGQHSQSLRLGRNYRISFCLLNIFKKRNSSQRPKTDMQNTA